MLLIGRLWQPIRDRALSGRVSFEENGEFACGIRFPRSRDETEKANDRELDFLIPVWSTPVANLGPGIERARSLEKNILEADAAPLLNPGLNNILGLGDWLAQVANQEPRSLFFYLVIELLKDPIETARFGDPSRFSERERESTMDQPISDVVLVFLFFSADQSGIQGVTYRLAQGVVKNIIPAVASTNAVIAAAAALEAFKIASSCATTLDNYLVFNDTDGPP